MANFISNTNRRDLIMKTTHTIYDQMVQPKQIASFALATFILCFLSGTARCDDSELRDYKVYAKIILPIKSPATGDRLAVEPWIAKELRKRGLTEFRAVTDWVRIDEGEERNADIWTATVDGKPWGCPVSGWVSEPTGDGKVRVELSGWSPVAVAKIKGNTLAANKGNRTIATVDTGIDQDGRAFVALLVGAPQAAVAFSQKPMAEGTWSYRNGKPEGVIFDYGTELTAKDIDRLSATYESHSN